MCLLQVTLSWASSPCIIYCGHGFGECWFHSLSAIQPALISGELVAWFRKTTFHLCHQHHLSAAVGKIFCIFHCGLLGSRRVQTTEESPAIIMRTSFSSLTGGKKIKLSLSELILFYVFVSVWLFLECSFFSIHAL